MDRQSASAALPRIMGRPGGHSDRQRGRTVSEFVKPRVTARLITVAIALVCGALVLEVAFRVIDRQPLTHLTLSATPELSAPTQPGAAAPDLKHLSEVPLTSGV